MVRINITNKFNFIFIREKSLFDVLIPSFRLFKIVFCSFVCVSFMQPILDSESVQIGDFWRFLKILGHRRILNWRTFKIPKFWTLHYMCLQLWFFTLLIWIIWNNFPCAFKIYCIFTFKKIQIFILQFLCETIRRSRVSKIFLGRGRGK